MDSLSNSIGKQISVTGFFRCLFEHPGYWGKADAHIFEIHPVGNLSVDGNNFGFPVGRPDPQSIHPWDAKITNQDAAVQVTYDATSDTLQFSNTGKMDENYVQATGQVSNIQINNDPAGLSSFQFTSQDIGYAITALCLPNTNVFAALGNLNNGDMVTLLGLRNIDLDQAIKNQQYVINLLAVDMSK